MKYIMMYKHRFNFINVQRWYKLLKYFNFMKMQIFRQQIPYTQPNLIEKNYYFRQLFGGQNLKLYKSNMCYFSFKLNNKTKEAQYLQHAVLCNAKDQQWQILVYITGLFLINHSSIIENYWCTHTKKIFFK